MGADTEKADILLEAAYRVAVLPAVARAGLNASAYGSVRGWLGRVFAGHKSKRDNKYKKSRR
jgi:hypothetical protein